MFISNKHIKLCAYLSGFINIGLLSESSAESLNLSQVPIYNKAYIQPNVMLLLDTSFSMIWKDLNGDWVTSQDGPEPRFEVAKRAVIDIIQSTANVRFCLSRFSVAADGNGSDILAQCGATKESIISTIQEMQARGSTPLAESLYEISRYFQGGPSAYHEGVSYTSPITNRCQKNYAIILTDGLPSNDTTFPDSFDPNYDGLAPATEKNDTGTYPQYSDGFGGEEQYIGSSLYLDDIAKYTYDTDLRDTTDIDIVGGESFNAAPFDKQNLITYTIGFGFGKDDEGNDIDVQMLIDAAEYGHGGNYNSNNIDTLGASFREALKEIAGSSQSVVAASSNSGSLNTGLKIYQTRYTSGDWRGELVAWNIEEEVVNGISIYSISSSPHWIAPVKEGPNKILEPQNRVLYSGYQGGKTFTQETFDSEPEWATWFNSNENIIKLLRGDSSAEGVRVNTLPMMGDVVNSSPLYVKEPTKALYKDNDIAFKDGQKYSEYYNDHKNREAMIYLGANDGMLHGYEAETGKEKLGYFPEIVLPNLHKLAESEYQHQFYVDGTPSAAEVFDHVDNKWRTVLVGGLRRGGQGIYALDVTNPNFVNTDAAANSTALWEFDDSDSADLGYTYSRPQIMRLNDGKFYVVLGNGYNNNASDDSVSSSGDAVLYLLNIHDGSIVKSLSTGVGIAEDPSGNGFANGLATVTGLDVGTSSSTGMSVGYDRKIDYIYAGDLFGNVWKFDFSSSDPDDWLLRTAQEGVIENPLKLFTACAGADSTTHCIIGDNHNRQSITSPLKLHKLDNGHYIVLFGTGKLLELTDADTSNIGTQSFYGIVDSNSTVPRSSLLQQKIIYQGNVNASLNKDVRISTDHKLSTQRGWFMNLHKPQYPNENVNSILDGLLTVNYVNEGEQVLSAAQVSNKVLSFYTRITKNSTDPCRPTTTNSFTMKLDAQSGSRVSVKHFDIDNNGVLEESDNFKTDKKNVLNEDVRVVYSGQSGGNGAGTTYVKITDDQGKNTGEKLAIELDGEDAGKTVKKEADESGVRHSWREVIQ